MALPTRRLRVIVRSFLLAVAACEAFVVGCNAAEGGRSDAGDAAVETYDVDAFDVVADAASDVEVGLNPDAEAGPELDANPEAGVDAAPEPLLGTVMAIENPANPLSLFAMWTTERPATSTLETDCGESFSHVYIDPELDVSHEVFVMGLVTGAHCDLLVTAHDEAGYEETAGLAYDVAAELSLALPPFTVTQHQPDATEPGWTLFDISDRDNDVAYMFLVDQQGRHRWYQQRGTAALALTVIPEGVLSGAMYQESAIIAWDGSIVWSAPFISHHDLRASPYHEGHLLWLGKSKENCPKGTKEGTVNEHNLATDRTVWTWRVCDHYVPAQVFPDWSHLNTVEPVPGEYAMILSLRDQHMLLKVDRHTGVILWRLGANGDFALAPDDVFYRQHSPEIQPDGHILLFDNGHKTKRPYSRAIELELRFTGDGEPESAQVVWEYVDESLFTPSRGDADRLSNGNTLITYGGVQPEVSTRIREVTPDGEVVWELSTPGGYATYRAERIAPQYGEVR